MIAILGDYDRRETHLLTDAALEHAGAEGRWLPTDAIGDLAGYAGILVAPGSPYRDPLAVFDAIRFARENGVPILGTCAGFQHMVLEYARHVSGFEDAQSAEYDPDASALFIHALPCSLSGKVLEIALEPGSLAAELYGSDRAEERYYCNFGVNPAHVDHLDGLRISGADTEGEFRIIELPEHPFFLGTLFVPQQRSAPGAPHPLVRGLVEAAVRRA